MIIDTNMNIVMVKALDHLYDASRLHLGVIRNKIVLYRLMIWCFLLGDSLSDIQCVCLQVHYYESGQEKASANEV